LRYRGPVGKDARAAIEAIIGHMVPVPNPEPPDAEGCPLGGSGRATCTGGLRLTGCSIRRGKRIGERCAR
jgi:hypothetical protein